MNSIRIHPVAAGLGLVAVALLGAVRAQQVRQFPGLSAEQQEILDHMSIVYLTDGQGGQTKTIRITGVNVQVVNGLDETDSLNGAGNLIVGYCEPHSLVGGFDRRGSHNLVVGPGHTFSSFGGLVSGYINAVSESYASVTGGSNNVSSGFASSVCGGTDNVASDAWTTVLGGIFNEAERYASTVLGGELNRSTGDVAVVVGGYDNVAAGDHSVVGGGLSRATNGPYDWRAGTLAEDE